ncbi:MAG: VTT domain-containing protein [Myxococcota bacterium]
MRSSPSRTGSPYTRIAQGSLLIALSCGLVWAWTSGAFASLDVEQLRRMVAAAGGWGPALFVVCFGLLQPFGVSAHLFILAAAVIWPPGVAVGMSWAGAMLAAMVAFVLSRYIARDLIEGLVPERLRKWDNALEKRGFITVLGLRLIFFTTFVVQLMFGLTRVRWRDYLAATAIGNLPVIVLEVVFADAILRWLGL